jgi:hypothetical protein
MARYTGPKTKRLLVNLARQYSELTKVSKKEIILQDSMEMLKEEERNQNMLSN